MRTIHGKPRGAALLTAVAMVAILMVMVAGLLSYVNQQRLRAITISRTHVRQSCAEAGLQFARSYFGRNQGNWGTYLAAPAVYNPVPASWRTAGEGEALQASIRTAGFQAAHPELFTDLDGDGAPDVYVFVRDNADEHYPALANWTRDNDQNVIVGTICISETMVPRRLDGTLDPDRLVLEALLSFTMRGGLSSQAAGGASGTGNLNR